MNRFLIYAMLAASCGLAACGGSDDNAPANPNDTHTIGSVHLYDAVKQAAPVIEPSAKAAADLTDRAMSVAYQLLRNYTYPDDEGHVDMSNIYKVLWETNMHFEDAVTRGNTELSDSDAELSPYVFSDQLGHSYTVGFSGEEGGYGSSVAYSSEGTVQRMLVSYKWAPNAAEQITIGVIQAAYDSTAGDVSVRFAQAVQYPAGSSMGGAEGSGFAIRAQIDGNSATHAFTLKMAIDQTSLIGMGISRGDGNYFLFRCGENYYSVPADATEADLASITPTDLAGVPATCASYATAVAAMVPYDVETDLPAIDLSDFDGGVAGTPVRYLMF